MDLYGYLGLFAGTWILGLAVGSIVWRCGRRWLYAWRIGCAALGATIFITPSLVGGHGGAAPFPGLLALVADPASFSFYSIAFIPTWLLCCAVLAAFEATYNWLLH